MKKLLILPCVPCSTEIQSGTKKQSILLVHDPHDEVLPNDATIVANV